MTSAVGSSTLGSGSSYENVFLNNPAPGTYQVYTTNWAVPPGYIYNGNATLGLSQPPYSFVTRSATYNIDSSSKTSGTPFTMTNDLRLVGAQNGGCVVLCAQDVASPMVGFAVVVLPLHVRVRELVVIVPDVGLEAKT